MPRPKQQQDDDDDSVDLEDSILSQMGEDEGDDESADAGDDDESVEDGGTDEGEEEEAPEDEEVDAEAQGDLLNLKPDKQGNLVNPKTGKIVAPAGAGRRFYEDLVKSRASNQQLVAKLNENQQLMQRAGTVLADMKAKVDGYESISKQVGLTPDEHAEALQFMAKFKNPATALDAIKYVLTRAAQRGINIEGLKDSPLDLKVITDDITKRIEEKLGPLTDRQKASDEQQELAERARTEINSFLNQNPEAREYFPVLVRMGQDPRTAHLTLNEAWLRLQNHLLREQRNLGLTKSRSRPGGRPNAGARGTNGPDDSPVNVDSSYKEIVKAVVDEHGGIDFD